MRTIVCLSSTKSSLNGVSRRSANYKPSSWDHNSLLSLRNHHGDQLHKKCHQELGNYVKQLIHAYKDSQLPMRLNLVHTLHQLGVAYHFQKDIKEVLESLSIEEAKRDFPNNVGFMALLFRLLRENGFLISHEILSYPIDKRNLQASMQNDIKGLLHLYEASYLAFEEEEILDEARAFSSKCLINLMPCMNQTLKNQVEHALEVPFHWRVSRLEARWFIDHQTGDENPDEILDPLILQFAKLDFNHVQVLYQAELANLSRWWRESGLRKKLPFARDRLVESFFYATGIAPDPNHGNCRELLSKLVVLIVNLDDVYDIYGTFDELVLFTKAIRRWDVEETKNLPDYMKPLYDSILQTSIKIASDVLAKNGWDALPLLKKSWSDTCQSFLTEANWYHNGYRPNLEEYLKNGWISSTAPLLMIHVFAVLADKRTTKYLRLDEMYPCLMRSCSMIVRLCNDSATHKDELERGDAPSSIACYMHDHGCTEQEAREAIKKLTMETWKKINGDSLGQGRHLLPPFYRDACVNLARMSVCIYQGGDGIGAPDRKKKALVRSLFMDPIQLNLDY